MVLCHYPPDLFRVSLEDTIDGYLLRYMLQVGDQAE